MTIANTESLNKYSRDTYELERRRSGVYSCSVSLRDLHDNIDTILSQEIAVVGNQHEGHQDVHGSFAQSSVLGVLFEYRHTVVHTAVDTYIYIY